MVILNKNEKQVTLPLNRFRSMLGTAVSGKEIISGKEVDLKDSISLEAIGSVNHRNKGIKGGDSGHLK